MFQDDIMATKKYYQTLSFADVKKLLNEHFKFIPKIEELPIIEADGRVLAEDIYSGIDVPHFNRSMRDGFAVRSEDTFNADEEAPVILKVIGNISAGEMPIKSINATECIQIATGAPIPAGADAIVMVEYTNLLNENEVQIFRSVVPGQHIIKKGNDIPRGSKILEKNRRLNPRDIGALAAIGKWTIKVYSLPKIALFSTGNEIIPSNEKLEIGKIFDINSYTLLLSLKRTGAIVIFKGILADDMEIAKHSLIEVLKEFDLIVLSGGTSKGIGDIFPLIIPKLGQIDLLIHGIRIKPGKPTLFATLILDGEEKLITMLPGYPTSAIMIFNLFLKDIIRTWSQLPVIPPKTITAKLKERVYSELGRLELKIVKLIRDDTSYFASPAKTDSDAITTLVGADGYFAIPEQVQIMEEGEEVEVILFDY